MLLKPRLLCEYTKISSAKPFDRNAKRHIKVTEQQVNEQVEKLAVKLETTNTEVKSKWYSKYETCLFPRS